jgi:hypothetical protein
MTDFDGVSPIAGKTKVEMRMKEAIQIITFNRGINLNISNTLNLVNYAL